MDCFTSFAMTGPSPERQRKSWFAGKIIKKGFVRYFSGCGGQRVSFVPKSESFAQRQVFVLTRQRRLYREFHGVLFGCAPPLREFIHQLGRLLIFDKDRHFKIPWWMSHEI
jgi:hypothetical protein